MRSETSVVVMKYDGSLMTSDQVITRVIRESGKSPFLISAEIGACKNSVKRWENKESLPRVDVFERFLENLGYEIRIVKKSEYKKVSN